MTSNDPEPAEPAMSSKDAELFEKIKVLPGSSDNAASFQILNEDHTLGNALRFFIMKNPDVEFCGYTIPHPSEPKMHIRIQTWDDTETSAFAALRKGCDDLIGWCEATRDKFAETVEAFNEDKKRGLGDMDLDVDEDGR